MKNNAELGGKNILLLPIRLPGVTLGHSNEVAGEIEIVVYDRIEDRHFKMTAHPRDLILDQTPLDEPTMGDDTGRIQALDILTDLALLTNDKAEFEKCQEKRVEILAKLANEKAVAGMKEETQKSNAGGVDDDGA